MTNAFDNTATSAETEQAAENTTPTTEAPLPAGDTQAAHAAEAARIGAQGGAAAVPAEVGDDEIVFASSGKDGQAEKAGGDGQRPTYEQFTNALVQAAQEQASEMGGSGLSARGVRLALARMGESVETSPTAVALGQKLYESGKYDRIPYSEAEAKPGDILVRPWSQERQAARGGNIGDIMVITGRNAEGRLQGANDHHVTNVQPDGKNYSGSYILRYKG